MKIIVFYVKKGRDSEIAPTEKSIVLYTFRPTETIGLETAPAIIYSVPVRLENLVTAECPSRFYLMEVQAIKA